MEHIYTVHTKLMEGKTYYFVKKIMSLPEFKGIADVMVGYGMHTDFGKACNIAGVDDPLARKRLLAQVGQSSKPKEPAKKPLIEISESVNKWLAEIGVTVLN